jgi:hypothetical protein
MSLDTNPASHPLPVAPSSITLSCSEPLFSPMAVSCFENYEQPV